MSRYTILIVDDEEINRLILVDNFEDTYRTLEAENGREALEYLENGEEDIAAVLLDLVMPEVDGFAVLRRMNESGLIKRIPVFVITASDNGETLDEAYRLGAADFILKPFSTRFINGRLSNMIELYRRRNDLQVIVEEQGKSLDHVKADMIETLATLIEFRDCESGEHVRRICALTRIIMEKVMEMYPEYGLTPDEIEKIVTASVLHDVGKISVPDAILNKPGRLTTEEFAVIKTHTTKGCEILTRVPHIFDEGVYDYCYDICRHHHERWDGRGYPDGLSGDQITPWAQGVALADVYDALTSVRCYKEAYSHEKSVEMIVNGECGSFNPKMLEAFRLVMRQFHSN